MTTNAFILSWDQLGIEGIVPISQYEKWDQVQLLEMLKNGTSQPNPLNQIVNTMILRARFNQHRHYEIYAIDCEDGITEDDWADMFETDPQGTADLVRGRGLKIHSDRARSSEIKIT